MIVPARRAYFPEEDVGCVAFWGDENWVVRDFGVGRDHVRRLLDRANERFENGLKVNDKGLSIPEDMRPLTRMIARQFDLYDMSVHGHSSAI